VVGSLKDLKPESLIWLRRMAGRQRRIEPEESS